MWSTAFKLKLRITVRIVILVRGLQWREITPIKFTNVRYSFQYLLLFTLSLSYPWYLFSYTNYITALWVQNFILTLLCYSYWTGFWSLSATCYFMDFWADLFGPKWDGCSEAALQKFEKHKIDGPIRVKAWTTKTTRLRTLSNLIRLLKMKLIAAISNRFIFWYFFLTKAKTVKVTKDAF